MLTLAFALQAQGMPNQEGPSSQFNTFYPPNVHLEQSVSYG